jgi:predicted nucleic acid-binding protein
VSGFLLDTNCISEAVRVHPEPKVMAWIEAADESMLYLSVLTLGEIRKGVAALTPSRRRTKLETWLEVELRVRFSERILSVDQEVADRWGSLAAGSKAKGKPLSTIDGLLAATALHHNLTIVSRNTGDFSSVPVDLVNPWET